MKSLKSNWKCFVAFSKMFNAYRPFSSWWLLLVHLEATGIAFFIYNIILTFQFYRKLYNTDKNSSNYKPEDFL